MTIFFNTGLRFNGEKAAFCTHIPVETQIANDIYIEKLSLPKKNCFVSRGLARLLHFRSLQQCVQSVFILKFFCRPRQEKKHDLD